jgi:hypothetical protein
VKKPREKDKSHAPEVRIPSRGLNKRSFCCCYLSAPKIAWPPRETSSEAFFQLQEITAFDHEETLPFFSLLSLFNFYVGCAWTLGSWIIASRLILVRVQGACGQNRDSRFFQPYLKGSFTPSQNPSTHIPLILNS